MLVILQSEKVNLNQKYFKLLHFLRHCLTQSILPIFYKLCCKAKTRNEKFLTWLDGSKYIINALFIKLMFSSIYESQEGFTYLNVKLPSIVSQCHFANTVPTKGKNFYSITPKMFSHNHLFPVSIDLFKHILVLENRWM